MSKSSRRKEGRRKERPVKPKKAGRKKPAESALLGLPRACAGTMGSGFSKLPLDSAFLPTPTTNRDPTTSLRNIGVACSLFCFPQSDFLPSSSPVGYFCVDLMDEESESTIPVRLTSLLTPLAQSRPARSVAMSPIATTIPVLAHSLSADASGLPPGYSPAPGFNQFSQQHATFCQHPPDATRTPSSSSTWQPQQPAYSALTDWQHASHPAFSMNWLINQHQACQNTSFGTCNFFMLEFFVRF